MRVYILWLTAVACSGGSETNDTSDTTDSSSDSDISDTADTQTTFCEDRELSCGEYTEVGPAESSEMSTYACTDGALDTPEIVFHFVPEATGLLHGFVDPHPSAPAAGETLLLLDGSCLPSSCVESQAITAYGDWAMETQVIAGQDYYLVVEGGTVDQYAAYALSIDCVDPN